MSFGNNTNKLTYGNLSANGSFGNLSSGIFSTAPSILDYLVIGGGGGGGGNPTLSDGYAGGGGAGGGGNVLRSFNTSSGDITTPINASSAGALTIVVGAGGGVGYNGYASSITASGISISAAGGNKGSAGSSTTGGQGGTSGSGNGGSLGNGGGFSRTACSGTPPNASAGSPVTVVVGGRYGGAGGGAGGAASGNTRGVGLSSSITGSSVLYASGGKSYGGASGYGLGRGGQGAAGDNELSQYIWTGGSSQCTQTSYSTIYYQSSGGGGGGGVYLRWSGDVPSSYAGGTLSLVGGDNLLSYTTAGTYTLIF